MTDDVLFLSGQRVTRPRDADPAIAPRSDGSGAAAKSGSGDPATGLPTSHAVAVAVAGVCPVAARTPSTTPVVRGTRPAPGCTVAGGGAFGPTRTGLVGLGDVPTGRAVVRAAKRRSR
jgi:hypothetical protein